MRIKEEEIDYDDFTKSLSSNSLENLLGLNSCFKNKRNCYNLALLAKC